MSWKTQRLESVADFCLGKMLDQRKNRGEPMPYLANVNVRWGEFDLNNLREMRFEQRESERYGLKYGDIVMCEGGEPGRCALWKDQLPAMMIQKALHRIRPHSCLRPDFLYYFFLHKGRMGHLSGLFTGATIKHLPQEKLALVEVPVPPHSVQDRIASILSVYDDLIENNRRRIHLLEESARLLYREWFVHFRFPGHENARIVDGVPEGWEKTSVTDIIDVNPKTTVDKNKEICYVPMASLSESGMTADSSLFEMRKKHTTVKFRRQDVLLARITPCLENGKTGFAYFLKDDQVACGSTEFIILRGKWVSSWFTYCMARSYDFRQNAIKSMIGSSGRQRVQVSCFTEFPAPLPPTALRQEFDEFVGVAFHQIENLMAQNSHLSQARDLLLPRLMNGEIEL